MGTKSKQKKAKQNKSTKISRKEKAASKRTITESLKDRISKKRVLNRHKKKLGRHCKNKRKGD